MRTSWAVAIIGVLACGWFAGCSGDSATAPTPPPEVEQPQLERPATLQAEAAPIRNGGQAIARGNAEGVTVWHLDRNQEIAFPFSRLAPGSFFLSVRYSNDDTGKGDLVKVLVNGVETGAFKMRDTGGSGPGAGWNRFAVTPTIPLGRLEGAKTITLRLTASDGWGVDLDSVTFTIVE